jgi:hypothetical protein
MTTQRVGSDVDLGPGWEVADDPEAWMQLVEEKQIGDGFPVIPPTSDRLGRWLDAIGRDQDELLGTIPPRWGQLTVKALAINAIMAGATPAMFPVLAAAWQGLLRETFNLFTVQVTTNPVTPLLMVGGPIAEEVGMNSSSGYLGPGNRANATIGRAVRLTMLNVGGAHPGTTDRSTGGHPGKYTLAFAENRQDSPWESFAASQGMHASSSVTLAGAVSIFNHYDSVSSTGEDMLQNMAHTLIARGTNFMQMGGRVLILLCPEHARTLDRNGITRETLQQELYERARAPVDTIPESLMEAIRWRRKRFPAVFDDNCIRALDNPQSALVAVAGGPGKHSNIIFSLSSTGYSIEPVGASADEFPPIATR